MTPDQIAAVLSAGAALVGSIAAVVSAGAAVAAIRAQRRAQTPHVRVTQSVVLPSVGHRVDDPWFLVEVVNDGLLPVTVTSAGITLAHGVVPYFRPPPGWGDGLPRRLESGDKATLPFAAMRDLADAHVDPSKGPALHASVGTTGGDFTGPPIKSEWLASFASAAGV